MSNKICFGVFYVPNFGHISGKYIAFIAGEGRAVMKNKTFLDSVKCAINGLKKAIGGEKNFRIYFLNVALFSVLNLIFRFSLLEFLVFGVCIAGVFSAECINTAIETFCDFITSEYSDKIRFIKDVAAGGVLCWGIAFYAYELIMIGMKLFCFLKCI